MKTTHRATAIAHPNIAFIKYWGNRDNNLRLPVNGSISMNLNGLTTTTTVNCDASLKADTFTLNHHTVEGPGLTRVSKFLDRVRDMSGERIFAQVVSENNFPTGAGIASSASAFAALSLAASRAIGLELDEAALSRLARTGSGSACRSVPAGFVEWRMGENDASSYAASIAAPEHWKLMDCIAVVRAAAKPTGSTEGHAMAESSPLQAARVADAPRRLELCRKALLEKDFSALAAVIELDSDMMHAVMMTSSPALFYWEPASLALIKAIPAWRAAGVQAAYTLDAGPNVHVLCPFNQMESVRERLLAFPGVLQVLVASPGEGAKIIEQG
jgi:diphosphomevalonate decarboxylase